MRRVWMILLCTGQPWTSSLRVPTRGIIWAPPRKSCREAFRPSDRADRQRRTTCMQVKFVTVDVFTERQFGGNPLAVLPDATGLSTRQMQAMASEFNLAETTFVLPPE